MIVGTVVKQPGETFPITIDFTNELESGETVVSATVTSKNVATGADSSGILTGIPAVTSPKVSQRVTAGTAGDRHLVQYRATTSLANLFEAEVDLRIIED